MLQGAHLSIRAQQPRINESSLFYFVGAVGFLFAMSHMAAATIGLVRLDQRGGIIELACRGEIGDLFEVGLLVRGEFQGVVSALFLPVAMNLVENPRQGLGVRGRRVPGLRSEILVETGDRGPYLLHPHLVLAIVLRPSNGCQANQAYDKG
jgi:hypothetical protein